MAHLKENLDQIQQKAKERTVKTQTIEYDLETIVKKIDKKTIKLNPEYQRRHRWSHEYSSRLIESLILNIPVPFIYISQDVDVDEEVDEDVSRFSVIDGQQRLTAIYEYFKGVFPLKGIDVLTELEGAFYKDLPPFLIRRLEERTIRCLRIDSTLDSQVKYDIFERLNSGSVKLEAQELRNAVCRGPFKKAIKRMSRDKVFIKLCNLENTPKRLEKMEDEELVLRFFALTYNDGYLEYRGGFKGFLTKKMNEFNGLSLTEIKDMEILFKKTFRYLESIADDLPFAKFKEEGKGRLRRMSSFNAAVFDAVSVAASKNLGNTNIDIGDYRKLFLNKEFFSYVEGSVNDVAKVTGRIKLALSVNE